jgi:hypothetical protein
VWGRCPRSLFGRRASWLGSDSVFRSSFAEHPQHSLQGRGRRRRSGKFDKACSQLLAMLGLHPSRFAQDGTGMAAVEQHIQYKRELHAGDAVTVLGALGSEG